MAGRSCRHPFLDEYTMTTLLINRNTGEEIVPIFKPAPTAVQCAMQIYLFPSPAISVETNAAVMAALVNLFSTNNGETITFAQWTAVVTPLIPGSTYIAVTQMIDTTTTIFGSPFDPSYTPPVGSCDFSFPSGTKGRFDLTKHIILGEEDLGISFIAKFS